MSATLSRMKFIVLALCFSLVPGVASAGNNGLSKAALQELEATGLNKYLGEYQPTSSEDVGDGWVKHSFDPAAGNGPICIDGSEYAVYTRVGRKKKQLLIMLQGGGACWQGLYQCTTNLAGDPNQNPPFERQGIWDFDNKANPLRDYSVAFIPYCDGSAFTGDNEVNDPAFPGGIRYHRGIRNVSAGLDVARNQLIKNPKRIVLAGTSAGGVGVATLTPFLVRMQYGNKVKKFDVINDAGPIVSNPLAVDAALARANDWAFGQFYPSSCTGCDPLGQPTEIIKWRLANDGRVREAFYGTDGDETDIAFVSVNLPGNPPLQPFEPENGVLGLTQLTYRQLFLPVQGEVHAAYPKRYKRFVVSGDDSHTALQTPLFYTQQARETVLNDWIWGFLNRRGNWVDIIDPYEPIPAE